MYLHLGNDVLVNLRCVVGIFDMDNTTVSYHTRNFLSEVQKRREVIDVTDDLPKSFILTEEDGASKVYISSLAPRTLLKRATEGDLIMNQEL